MVINIHLIDLTGFIVWDQKQNKNHLPYCTVLSQFRVLLLNYDQLQKLTTAKRSHMRSKAWNFPRTKGHGGYDQWPVSLRETAVATFETTAVATLPKITSRIMHFFNVQLPPESLEQTTPIIPASTDPAAAMRLPEIERSRWQYCAKQRHLREVQKSVRWWEGQEKVSPKSAGFFFFLKYHFGTGFFLGGCFYFLVTTFESSNPISVGSMMSLTMCCDLVGGLTWPRARESVDVLPHPVASEGLPGSPTKNCNK